MITIVSVEIVNIRSIGHATFTPRGMGEGATALVGRNGAGKSSVLTAMLWALYGTVPDGTTTASLRRQGTTPGEDPCKVVVTFTHDNQTIVVERGFKGARDAAYVMISVDGTETTYGKIRAAEEWIVNRIRLSRDAFLTAFVVRQKELDGLIKARPAERRQLVERLAGIDRLEAAVKAARSEENEARRHLDLLPGSAEEVNTASTALEAAENAAISAYDDLQAAAAEAKDANETLENARGLRDDLQTRVNQFHQYEAETARLTGDLTVVKDRLTAVESRIADVKVVADQYDAATMDNLRAEKVAAETALQSARSAAERHQAAMNDAIAAGRREDAADDRRVAADKAHATAVESLSANRERLAADFPASLNEQAAAAEAEAAAAGEAHAELQAEYRRLHKAIETLSAAAACCPTCSAPLDDPNALIATLTRTRDEVMAQGVAARDKHQAVRAVLEALNRQHQDRDRVAAQTPLLERQVEAARSALEDATTEARKVAVEANTARERAAQAHTEMEAAGENTTALTQTLEEVAQRIRHMENARDAAKTLEGLEGSRSMAVAAVTTAENALAAVPVPSGTAPTSAELQSAAAAAAAAEQSAREATDRERAADRTHVSADRDVQDAERNLETARQKVAARAAQATEVEKRSATVQALDAFRRERVARIAPELSETATDLLVRMTEGRFTALDLDEQFTPRVTDSSGAVREASWLSGGEESAVALALRVAIGELIAGQHGGLLWLDEVLTAQDTHRRPAMVRAISALPGRQVIMINHIAEATDMVDAVFEVAGGDDGSTITHLDQTGPVSEASVLA